MVEGKYDSHCYFMAGAGSLCYPFGNKDVNNIPSQLDFWSDLIFKDLMYGKLKGGACYGCKECEMDHRVHLKTFNYLWQSRRLQQFEMSYCRACQFLFLLPIVHSVNRFLRHCPGISVHWSICFKLLNFNEIIMVFPNRSLYQQKCSTFRILKISSLEVCLLKNHSLPPQIQTH